MNINNIKNLLIAYFIENWKKDVINLSVMALITLVFNFIGPSHDSVIEVVVAVIWLFLYASRIFNELGNSSKSIHYLMIPANHYEKTISAMLLVNIYFVVLMAAGIWIGYSISYFLQNQILSALYDPSTLGSYMSRYQSSVFGEGLLAFYVVLSVFFFGSIFFRRKAFVKTILWTVLIAIAFGGIITFVTWLNMKSFGAASFNGDIHILFPLTHQDPQIVNKVISDGCGYCIECVVIIYFYVLSFLRLKETEA